MNRNHLRILVGCLLPLSLPLFSGCIDESDGFDELAVERALPSPTMNRISAGNLASLVLRSDGTISSSGDNTEGQLGDGSTSDRTSPGPVNELTGVIAVSAAATNYSLALTDGGELYSWGSELWGQLGDGSNMDQPEPVLITALSGVTAMVAANSHGLAVTSDGVQPNGTVWAWGNNISGQLGDGSNSQRKTPVPLGLSGVSAVAGGAGHSLALKGDGTVYAWGRNAQGQLGNESYDDSNVPVLVHGLEDIVIVAVAAAGKYSLALEDDGTVYAWGETNLPDTGCAPTQDPTLPEPVSGLSNIKALAAGHKNILALDEDGAVFGWGRNGHGELGDGTNIKKCTPVPALGLSRVTAISAGESHSLAQTSNGMVFAFGSNSHGQLGDGADLITNRTTPVPTTFNGGADCSNCASWPMPNPASTGLPHPSNYTSQTGHVIDDVTGLQWQQSAGCSTGCTQADANTYCEGLSLDGYGDWRLPTRIELVSIVDDTEHLPAIDPDAFPSTSNSYFWTSTPMVSTPNNAFRIGGAEGDTSYGMNNNLNRARCVREPAAAPASEYEIQADGTPTGTVVDTGTWLTWQQDVPEELYTWNDAVDYCEGNALGLPGTGWRLPSMKELQTIVDDSHVSPAIDPDAFPGTPFDVAYWTSTQVAWQPGYAWYVLFNIGLSNHSPATTATMHVRCVR